MKSNVGGGRSKDMLSGMMKILLVNIIFYFATVLYLSLYGWLKSVNGLRIEQFYYVYLLALPLTLVFVISRESSDELKISTQVAVFLCLSMSSQFAFCGFYLEKLCILVPNVEAAGEATKSFSSSVEDLLYFSFLTYGTLGYGDFTPTGICRPVAAIQSIFGVMSVAVLLGLISRQE